MKKILIGALALVMTAGAAQAQSKDTTKHHGKHGKEMMAKKLNLTEDQQARLKTIHQEQRKEMQSVKSGSLSTEQQKAKRQELHKKYSEKIQSVYTAEQKAQLDKMKADWKAKAREGNKDFKKGRKHGKGGKDFKDKAAGFQKELNLTEQQKASMAKLRTESKTKLEALRSDKTLTEDQKKEKVKSIMKEQRGQMKSILTPEQLEKMKSFKKERKSKETR